MAESTQKPRGCISRLFSLFLFAAAVGLVVAVCYVFQPQDLSDIEGYGKPSPSSARDLTATLESAVERGFSLTIPEKELNEWLAQTLVMKQGGGVDGEVTLKGVAVRLEKDRAEVILERLIFGKPFTVSMFIRIEQSEGEAGVATTLHRDGGAYNENFPKLKKGGRFGKLVVPQGLLLLVLPSFAELGEQFSKEIGLGFEGMSRVVIEEGGLTLDPRGGIDENGVLPGAF